MPARSYAPGSTPASEYPAPAGSDPALGPVNALFDLTIRDPRHPHRPLKSALASALSASLGWVYVAVAIMAVIGAVLALRFPQVERAD